MSICGSNLIPIFISLLCCGAIFIYFNLRLNEVKFAVEKQNRVLTAFITNVQQDIRAGGGGCMLPIPSVHNNFAAPEAIIAAQKFMNESDKIVVSDDEEDDDSDSDSDSSDSDEDEDEEAPTIKNIKIVNLQERPKIPIAFEFEELTCVLGESSTVNNPESSSIMEIMDVSLSLANVNVSEANVSVSEANVSVSEANVSVSVSEANTNANTNATTDAPTTYEQMKIDELRKVATDKNLAPKEEIKRMKKPELLVLLKK
jgi:hypothetical protein